MTGAISLPNRRRKPRMRLAWILGILVVGGTAYWWRQRSLDSEARELFVPAFAKSNEPFDIDKTLFEGEPVSALMAIAKNGTEEERARAIWGLYHVNHGCTRHCMHSGYCGPPAEARQRMLYLAERGTVGQRAPFLLPTLIDALKDPSPEVRATAASALECMYAEALSAIPALQAALRDPDANVRSRARQALNSIQS